MKLNIGGRQPATGWANLSVTEGENVDYVGDFDALEQFEDNAVETIYCCHYLQRLGYSEEVPNALGAMHRILTPGGEMMLSVPDLEALCGLFSSKGVNEEQRYMLMRMMYGAQLTDHDFNATGFTWPYLEDLLKKANFASPERVLGFGLFQDESELRVGNVPISINVRTKKPG